MLWSSVCTHEHSLLAEIIRVTVHRAWFEWARFSHHDHQCVQMSSTYSLSESESPSTGHGWNEQGFHIMIISVYTWAQLTCWDNPSHRPQGMVGMSKVFTSWSSVCTYEHNLQTEWIWVTVHRAWLKWARFHIMIISVYTWAQLTCWDNPSHRPQGMVGMSKVFTSWSSVCTYEHNLQTEWIQVTVHKAQLEIRMSKFLRYDHQCVHMSTTYILNESDCESPSTRHGWNVPGVYNAYT